MMIQTTTAMATVTPCGPAGIKIFADGASVADFVRLHDEGRVTGFTTNPTLMRKAQVTDYEGFAKELLAQITDMPISFEVFSDELEEMERQARKIASWGDNIFIKIPITNTRGESTLPIVRRLSHDGVKVNVTAILTLPQVAATLEALDPQTPAIVSVFAGRIADTGVDPMPIMRAAVAMAASRPKAEVLWASVREALNIYQAEACGCHIVTSTPDVLKKMEMGGKDLEALSLETVAMFRQEAVQAGYTL
ncbi:transaldolase [Phenylobacterium sp. VNQ135]|uniref:transaldolase n=1 Tax=Phenylobacterium sp. VNQ135 TaxID=3400922 RepID=UPI003C0E34FE